MACEPSNLRTVREVTAGIRGEQEMWEGNRGGGKVVQVSSRNSSSVQQSGTRRIRIVDIRAVFTISWLELRSESEGVQNPSCLEE